MASGRGGFSLVELLLVLVVLLLLLSAAVANVDAMRHGAELREGVLRVESLLRFSRAEAALRGRRIRVEFQVQPLEDPLEPEEPVPDPVRLTIESDPLVSPGEFSPLPMTSWGNRRLGEFIQLEQVLGGEHSDGNATAEGEWFGAEGSSGGRAAPSRVVSFEPEGGAADVRLVVRSMDPDDSRRMLVALDGLTGRVTHQELSGEELESLQSEAEAAQPGAVRGSAETPMGGDAR
ncbi:MAG: prepilin-type N-terminal cleavage/methylation domain-containing protein [Verrucomicrobiales bacterium]|nr:prepilin-type N-terminal cleavage/methylation domain-containing protein [Verrucomicrobiales bacterium]